MTTIDVGEIAIVDHRSSQSTWQEMAKIAAAARIGGLLSGKAGIVNVHVGDSQSKLKVLEEVVEYTDIPFANFIQLIPIVIVICLKRDSLRETRGYVDFTTSTIPTFLEQGEIKRSKGLKEMLATGVSIEQITFTSDGQASLPSFNERGEFAGLQSRACFIPLRRSVCRDSRRTNSD
ncbi:amidohydrolase family protein [Thermaerobacillus caldiproteolyticus]|uniref:hypothetical protein n=1 Tax=Thermaerobacillus caldiproteolyticus TaxID=247480 RepID=UPI001F379BF1|nr:hypothetical protein [Anoxybacillus caldiproteolyticus]